MAKKKISRATLETKLGSIQNVLKTITPSTATEKSTQKAVPNVSKQMKELSGYVTNVSKSMAKQIDSILITSINHGHHLTIALKENMVGKKEVGDYVKKTRAVMKEVSSILYDMPEFSNIESETAAPKVGKNKDLTKDAIKVALQNAEKRRKSVQKKSIDPKFQEKLKTSKDEQDKFKQRSRDVDNRFFALKEKMQELELREDMKEVFTKNNQALKALPSTRKFDKYAIVRLPAALRGRVQRNKLKDIGIQFDAIDSFTIMHDQLMIAVNTEFATNNDVEPLEIAKIAKNVLEKKTSNEYQFVSEDGKWHPKAKGFVFFWIMSDRQLSRLINSADLSVEEWGIGAGTA